MTITLPDMLARPGRWALGGVPEGQDARLLAALAARRRGGILMICRDDARMAALEQALRFFAPDLPVIGLPAWDCQPYDRVSPNAEIAARRMDALSRLAGAKPPEIYGKGWLLLTTLNAALQRLPQAAYLEATALSAAKGGRLPPESLIAYLSRNGYSRVSTVMEAGEFAVRGGLVDLFPPGAEAPYRLDFFGDTVESIRLFDPASQRSIADAQAAVQALTLAPMSEVPLDEDSIARFRGRYRELFGAVTSDDPLYAAVSEGRRHIGMEHWLPLFFEQLSTLFDYMPDAPVVMDALLDDAADERFRTIADHYDARRAAMKSGLAEAGSPYKPLPPERLYFTAGEWSQRLAKHAVGALSPFEMPGGQGIVALDIGARPGRDFAPERAQATQAAEAKLPSVGVYEALGGHLAKQIQAGKRVLFAAYSIGARDRLALVLKDHGIQPVLPVELAADLEQLPRNAAGIAVLPLEHGFDAPDLCVIAEQDILGDRLVRAKRRQRRAENFIAEASGLSPGDYVVHVDHGIGCYQGLVTLDIGGAPHDCLLLHYDGGDRLYLPVENIEMLSRYGSAEAGVTLDKLGGVAWQNRKSRMKKRLKDMAEALMKVAAQRALRKAERIIPPEGLYEEFCARFPFEETEDQDRAINDTLDDMGAGRPMDRLVCGDVGFGKTEVAIRAAFAAAMAGQQVALICPTTLLCRQHFRTFVQRFRGLPVRIEQLSRLVNAKASKAAKQGLADGGVDIIIGTHALLAKNIEFKRLGLLIIDEEQHFGVKHKERMKELRAEVHVLTMSATPIPRTLQLALSGVRELSLIATPPVDRLAVRTYVAPFDPVIIREALLREHFRGGQSFFVVPRIEDLEFGMSFIKSHVPELKPVMAHGQMAPTDLEDVMNAFYDGRYNVLVATNIVESGLDIPTANTMVVYRADLFGLAQMYQLRGRVGRSKLRAYAYFTYQPGRLLNPSADQRLRVLQSLDGLGAGFTLASHDLDLRGAGNLLGEEQSGHIREVGFELYQEMLQQAIQDSRAEARGQAIASEKWSPQIQIGTAVLIPEAYVPDLNLRLQLYRRVADLEGREEIDAFAAELIDRFGPLPAEVQHLLDIVAIKKFCRDASIAKIEAGPKGATLAFRDNSFIDPPGMVLYIQTLRGQAKLRPDHKLVLLQDWPSPEQRLAGVLKISSALSDIALKAQARKKN
ncbi:transcription-repair coupling factor [Ferrovibrio sp.]|uniref:transcription-repair coupling factor n=1 Tax=Ferrovibrio sp. TaxID=1917215 RepID=UPI001B760F22|nr:transcription-repair coupling factor [Ferrovibrio sp.]MBP7066032.1 transcription-repair coupling factor [Ferrovibrio sp.]